MEVSMLDNSSPNIDVMHEVINSLWNEKSKRDICRDQLAGKTQWPSIVHEESTKVSTKKDDDTIPKAIQVLAESPVTNSNTIQKDQISYSNTMVTSEPPSPMWYDYCSDMPTFVPVPSFMLSPESQPAVMTHNQPPSYAQTQPTCASPLYEINGAVVSMAQIEQDIQRNCPGVVVKLKIDPLQELQPVLQASQEPVPSQVMHELPIEAVVNQTPSCMYEPSRRAPLNQLMTTPNTDNLGTRQVQDFPTIATPSTSSIHKLDVAAPTPGMTCAEYFSAVQLTSDLNISEPSSAYIMPSPSYDQVPSLPFRNQAATHPVPATPTPQAIDPSSSYVQVPNRYILPAVGNSIVYPVQEYYRVNAAPQPVVTMKPISRKRPSSNGTPFYCNSCKKLFVKEDSYRQHMRQKHQGPRSFRCVICKESYPTEQDMLEHWQSHDPSMKRHKCKSCNNRYRTMKDRDRHFETHHSMPPAPLHACVVTSCPRAFVRHDEMLAHMISHEKRWKRERLREEKENYWNQRGSKSLEE